MSDLQDGHYVQMGPATELRREVPFGDPALCRGGALLRCVRMARLPGLLPNWLDSCDTRLVDVPLFPPASMRWK
jgi:hypothetical protein